MNTNPQFEDCINNILRESDDKNYDQIIDDIHNAGDIRNLSKEHIDYFIFGHRHLPIVHQLKTKSKYINLGDWITHFTYGVFDGKTFTLINFLKKND